MKAKSQLALELLTALEKLTRSNEPHPCGGFTTDDMEWAMGTGFTGESRLQKALDELLEARLISYAGFDEDGCGHCYEL